MKTLRSRRHRALCAALKSARKAACLSQDELASLVSTLQLEMVGLKARITESEVRNESLQETIVLADQAGVRGAAHTDRPRDDSPERSGEGLRRLRPAGSSAARGVGPLVAHRHSGASLPRKHRHRIVTFSPISPSDAELAVAGIP